MGASGALGINQQNREKKTFSLKKQKKQLSR
jgi:hypothetical protein